ncbi:MULTISPECIES: YbaB/EbfC family nucleoid-associated protein [Leptospira]|uniref:Nucleoid-associated protein LBJ_3002 n=9 Tax=Leptospira TaxID=171 RepID=Y3002_LEPBJ|nr:MULTISPECIES: YbaB/EbfC family nucleoid-associated protein [Leptospira]Q04NY0.1 RecName: Full=Nucleoid-associated protein LBJ_3002 [Leptospira borgpetersenii serovar Hardjo-bovis str. JB197]Q056Q2.1 RecName: Full=Nucleoid-associated protein LBL_0065 [Leptospira borgpetersenii serovar Hardjo-bovis str. L550]EMG00081.1 DNA-binding protein, YbaB/EbfC family [Leptospira borgpetersenii str. 200701203]EMO63610.1 DNA-binding protein, YbaB/EbfC family [Leptospira borgpetersenii serovar Pomona str. 2
MLDKIKNLSELLSNMGALREKMEDVKKRIASIRVVGDAGAGMVTVTATGEGQIINVFINKQLFDSDDNKMLEDLVMAATNDALKKAKEATAYEFQAASGGLDFSEISKMFGGNFG